MSLHFQDGRRRRLRNYCMTNGRYKRESLSFYIHLLLMLPLFTYVVAACGGCKGGDKDPYKYSLNANINQTMLTFFTPSEFDVDNIKLDLNPSWDNYKHVYGYKISKRNKNNFRRSQRISLELPCKDESYRLRVKVNKQGCKRDETCGSCESCPDSEKETIKWADRDLYVLPECKNSTPNVTSISFNSTPTPSTIAPAPSTEAPTPSTKAPAPSTEAPAPNATTLPTNATRNDTTPKPVDLRLNAENTSTMTSVITIGAIIFVVFVFIITYRCGIIYVWRTKFSQNEDYLQYVREALKAPLIEDDDASDTTSVGHLSSSQGSINRRLDFINDQNVESGMISDLINRQSK